MEVLRIADKEGWDVALAYVSEDLVQGPDKEKKLKKARRYAQDFRETKKKRAPSRVDDRFSMKKEDGNEAFRGKFKTFRDTEKRTCWSCGRMGHLYENCPKKGRYTCN